MNDSDLLRRFAEEHADEAFAELVRRRIGLVYSAALRQVGGDAHRAEDVTQEVFIDLARKARSLARHPALIGWLYTSTHFAAAKSNRTEQRRNRREQEAHLMHATSSTSTAEPDWERVHPVLDAAMHELSERDRQTVLLRFFDQQPFARIGQQLGVSENAAQKAVDRALDKLQSALARRGVTSTGAALAVALAGQAAAAAPAALAASVTGAALTGATTATGVVAWFGASKMVAALGGAVAIAAGGVAVVEHQRARDAESARVIVEQQQKLIAAQQEESIAARLAELGARAERAEQRAIEAEKDNESWLKAVDAFKAQQGAQARPTATTPRANLDQVVGMAGPVGDDEALVYQRAYQQELARRRAQEAQARAKADENASMMDDASAYHRWINLARHLFQEASFQEAIRAYNKAMAIKPATLEVTPEIRQLQADLQAQNTPVEVTIISDGLTWVTVTNARAPEKLTSRSFRLSPGNYQVKGQRKGYRDVGIDLVVRSGKPVGTIRVVCTELAER
jgi:RNA polymerase sigma factor (sigma-70 family)